MTSYRFAVVSDIKCAKNSVRYLTEESGMNTAISIYGPRDIVNKVFDLEAAESDYGS
jgi:hypothetical protein